MRNKSGELIFVEEIIPAILSADGSELEEILLRVQERYAQLSPQQELHCVTLFKSGDRIQQLDEVIAFIERLKEA